MIYKNTSVKRVIAKVFTDLDLQEGEHRVSDMIEWAGEALEKIGAFPSFVNKVTGKDGSPLLAVENYQTKLPCDFHRMIQLSFSTSELGPFYPVRYATGSFDHGSILNSDNTYAGNADTDAPETSLTTLAMSLYDLDYEAAVAKLAAEPDTRSQLNSIIRQMEGSGRSLSGDDVFNETLDYTYVIKPGYIKMNASTGYIMMAYQAIPVDDDGYPLVPDDASFLEAIYWYISMKLMYPQWKQGSVRDAVYYDARRSWNYYCKQAYGNALAPNKDQLESIKNTWNRLVPELKEWNSGFSAAGQRQIIYNANE